MMPRRGKLSLLDEDVVVAGEVELEDEPEDDEPEDDEPDDDEPEDEVDVVVGGEAELEVVVVAALPTAAVVGGGVVPVVCVAVELLPVVDAADAPVDVLLVEATAEEPDSSAPPQPASAIATLPSNTPRTKRPDPNPRLAISIQIPEK